MYITFGTRNRRALISSAAHMYKKDISNETWFETVVVDYSVRYIIPNDSRSWINTLSDQSTSSTPDEMTPAKCAISTFLVLRSISLTNEEGWGQIPPKSSLEIAIQDQVYSAELPLCVANALRSLKKT